MIITIDNKQVEVTPGETILEAAKRAEINIPILCYHEAFGGQGMCRMCMVEVKSGSTTRLVASCTYSITEEIEVKTSTPVIEKIRRNIVMLLSKHAAGSKLMNELYNEYGCTENTLSVDHKERCILCRLCVKACEEMGTSAISAVMRGTEKRISTPYDEPALACIGCGACAEVCPTGAIEMTETENQRVIWNKTFELVKCERCGKTVGTADQLRYMENKLGQNKAETSLCERCREKVLAEKLAQYSQ